MAVGAYIRTWDFIGPPVPFVPLVPSFHREIWNA